MNRIAPILDILAEAPTPPSAYLYVDQLNKNRTSFSALCTVTLRLIIYIKHILNSIVVLDSSLFKMYLVHMPMRIKFTYPGFFPHNMSDTHDDSASLVKQPDNLDHISINSTVESSELSNDSERDVECGAPEEVHVSDQSDQPSRGTKRMVWIAVGIACSIVAIALGLYLVKHYSIPALGPANLVGDNNILTSFTIDDRLKRHMELAIANRLEIKKFFKKKDNISYFIKPIRLTNEVFTFQSLKEQPSQMDSTWGIIDKTYLAEELNDIDNVESLFKSRFECIHYILFHSAIHSILRKDNEITLSWFFKCKVFKSIDNCKDLANNVIVRLFNCVLSENYALLGEAMIKNVLESDLYQALISIFAKAAIIDDNDGTPVVTSESLSDWFPMWYSNDSNYLPKMTFKEFAPFMVDRMYECLRSLSPQQSKLICTDPKLETVMHYTFIYIYYRFKNGDGDVNTIKTLIGKDSFLPADGMITFAEFTKHHDNLIPVIPETKTPLLPIAPEDYKPKSIF